MIRLSKSSYLVYRQCAKAVWLETHRPDLAAPPDPAAQRRLRAGQTVDRLARERFPDGRLIPYRPQPAEMAALTAEAIAAGAQTLFQATFVVDDLVVKADILVRAANGWRLVEAKSSVSYKEAEHLPDVAFQLYVLREAGLRVTAVNLMHLNGDHRHPDVNELFVLTDVTAAAEQFLPQAATAVAEMRQLLAQAAPPEVNIGRHCRQPQECSFYAQCWQSVTGWTIYDIPYLKREKERQLEAAGARALADLPPDFVLGDKRAAAFVARVRERLVTVDADAIRAELDGLTYPLYFFDFETIDYAAPLFAGCKPYQQTPFQYSCHVLTADGRLTHYDYLHTAPDDPRRPLAESLLNHIGPDGHIVAYNISFERGVLLHLAENLPEYADRLQGMAERLWDQLAIFRRYYQHYRFGKSNSLKSVLPVIVPALSYAPLAVRNGTEAQAVWEELVAGETAVNDQLVEQLRDYCRLDTLAMVEIHRALRQL